MNRSQTGRVKNPCGPRPAGTKVGWQRPKKSKSRQYMEAEWIREARR